MQSVCRSAMPIHPLVVFLLSRRVLKWRPETRPSHCSAYKRHPPSTEAERGEWGIAR